MRFLTPMIFLFGMLICSISVYGSFKSEHPSVDVSFQNNASYCVPNLSGSLFIRRFSYGTLNVSTGNNNGYGDFTSLSTDIAKGSAQSMTITPSVLNQQFTYYIWLDLNQDGDFTDAGELLTIETKTGAATFNVTVPNAAMNGKTRLRIGMFAGIVPQVFPLYCAVSGTGEFEDYSIVIKNGSNDDDDDDDDSNGYCKPSLASNSFHIYRVELGSINNASGNDGGYGDYSNLQTDVQKGVNQQIKIVPNNMSASYVYFVWADLNRDNDFSDAGELLVQQSRTGMLTTNLIIPSGTQNGDIRLRIAMFNGVVPNIFPLACAEAGSGEFEDYTIKIINAETPPSTGGYCTPNPSTGVNSYSGALSGANEVPAINTSASGTVTANLNGNTLQLSGSFNNLQSKFNAQIGAHIHNAPAGSNGPIMFALKPTFNTQDSVSGVFMPANNTFNLSNAQVQALKNGSFYVNIHTLNFPAGELRAQLLNQAVFINRVALNTINNTSGNNNGYADFSSQSTTVQRGQSQSITVMPNDQSKNYNYRVWVDFNQDNDFEDAGELVLTTSATGTLNTSFNIPANALTGNTRIRVAVFGDMVPAIFPLSCVTSGLGEFEDYTLNIQQGQTSPGSGGYCVPNLQPQSIYLQRVLFETIDNTSGNNGGYADFSNQSTNVRAGQQYYFAIWTNNYSNSLSYYIWIDLNGDNDFSDPGELVNTQRVGGTYTGSFTIPTSAKNGRTRMRVAVFDGPVPAFFPLACVRAGRGEMEDYSLVIQNGSGGMEDDDKKEYCKVRGTSSHEFIQRVKFGSIDNNSGNNGGYADFTSQQATVRLGSTVPITVTPGFRSGKKYQEYFFVYIDYNRNGVFDADELVVETRSNAAVTRNINIPQDNRLLNKSTRMRVIVKYYSTPKPCGTFSYGEVEDYTIAFSQSSATDDRPVASRTRVENTLKLSPNPTNGFIRLQLEEEIQQADVRIFDMQGRVVFQHVMDVLDSRLDVLNLQAGVYQLQVRSDGFIKTESFIKM